MLATTTLEHSARRIGLALAILVIAAAQAQSARGVPAYGSAEAPVEVILPFELQASLRHSLPIAGHVVTPDMIAQLVTTDPRLRATTGLPYSGKGMAYPIHQSDAVGTHADLTLTAITSIPVRGAGRAPKP